MSKSSESAAAGSQYGMRQGIGLFLGILVFVGLLLLPAPAEMDPAAWRTAAVGLLMAIWWMSEAIPIPVTALLPLVLFPLMGIGTIEEAASPFANPLIFLFMGGFMIALGMERWDLHRRLALNVLRFVGTRPAAIIGGFMVAGAFLSMWVSNTATAVMMLPIAISVAEVVRSGDGEESKHFAVALFLSLAYACSIGGVGTLIGTPPNALLAGFMQESYGVQIGFAQWMMMGLPVVFVGLPIVFVLLTRVLFPIKDIEAGAGAEFIKEEVRRLGAITVPERRVAIVFGVVALLWMTRPLLEDIIPGLSDAGIAMFGALLLFLIPVKPREGVFLLDWETTKRLPWDVLILFGGGLSLASAITRTGLAEWIGTALSAVEVWPLLLAVLIMAAVTILLTELTSNTATAAAFLPITASVAVGIGEDPLVFALPVAVAASCAFMLPVATPPNAIVYGSGKITIPQMAQAGVWLNLLFAGLIALLVYFIAPLIFGVPFE